MALTRTRIIVLVVVGALLSAFALGAVMASSASAQLPAICTQYPDLPQCQEGGDDEEDEDDDEDADDDGGLPQPTGAGPSADAGAGGELPFTGYPLTGLILLLLILLLTGLALRAYLAVRDRIGGDRTAGH